MRMMASPRLIIAIAGYISITVSREHHKKHPCAGAPVKICASELGDSESARDLKEWVTALQCTNLPVVNDGWKSNLEGGEVTKVDYFVKDTGKPVGALGNRLMWALIKYGQVSSPFSQGNYALACFDGTETDGKPSTLLPVFDAAVSPSGGVRKIDCIVATFV